MPSSELDLPPQLALDGRVLGNPIRQVARTFARATFDINEERLGPVPGLSLARPDGTIAGVIVAKRVTKAGGVADLLRVADLARLGGRVDGVWIKPTPDDPGMLGVEEAKARCARVLDSFRGAFAFREERRDGDLVVEVGLRPPQTGALHAILAHWKVTDSPATVVMPTGTGKTETMLAVLAWERSPRLLVVVPGDALRKQVGEKFLTMGLLRQLGVLDGRAGHPVVGMLEHMPQTAAEVDEVFLLCNVVVTTMSIAGRCSEAVKGRMAEVSSHLFIDEAHHVPARSWEGFRTHFAGKPVVQFTATPFPRDGKLVDGRVLFN